MSLEQDKNEWLSPTKDIIEKYHNRQYERIYRSTEMLCDWLEDIKLLDNSVPQKIIDIGAGSGANVSYIANRFNRSHVDGIELNQELVDIGNKKIIERRLQNAKMHCGDLYNLEYSNFKNITGLISFQVLSWLPEYKLPLSLMAKANPEWIAMTSLFFEGKVECEIKLVDHTVIINNKVRESYYNIYSLPLIEKCFKELGYTNFYFKRFEIDIDLPRTNSMGMGSFTENLTDGRRLQISGPLMMPWYFVAASK